MKSFSLKIQARTRSTDLYFYNPKGRDGMSGKRFTGARAKKNSFYIALAICLVAIGIAAWSTYEAVNSFVDSTEPVEPVNQAEVSKEQTTSKETQANEEDGEAVKRSRAASSAAERGADKHEAESATSAARQTDTSDATSSEGGFVSQEQEYGHPVNAGVIYEISEVMLCPMASDEVTKAYSAGAPVYSDTMKDWRLHNGVDFQAETGEPVKAAANGQVVEIQSDSLLGNYIVIEHGDYRFRYCGMSEEFLVALDDLVTAGQEIGTVTAAPFESAEPTHLHLEVTKDGVHINPEEVLQSAQ